MTQYAALLLLPAIALTAAAPADSPNLLTNGKFASAEDGATPGWDTSRTEHRVALDRAEHPDGASQSLRVEVTSAKRNLGEILQRIKLKPDTRYTVSGQLRSDEKGMALLQVKRLSGGKEVQRISAGWSQAERWTSVDRTFNSGSADEALVILRWRQDDEHVGKSAWFADIALREAPPLMYRGTTVPARGVPTFSSIGLYWKPTGASPDREATVAYRKKGAPNWHEGMSLWFDPNEHTEGAEEHSYEYRGSIVHLAPDTTYEVRLALKGTDAAETIEVTTWSETPKIARTVELPAAPDGTYEITEGGSAEDGYVAYAPAKGTERVWDAEGKFDAQVKIDASFVILRGLTLKNAAVHGVVLGDVHDVIIEDCDISGWGKVKESDGFGANLNSAVYSTSRQLERIVVQRCKLHHPRSDSNSWNEKQASGTHHPGGPQGISFVRGRGHYVVRYNRIYSDIDHMFNDGMGETKNFSYLGFPRRDSDIHDNFVSHCWDDALEIEGMNMNVRVWNNYMDMTYGAIGAASTSVGPSYFWRNVYAVSRKHQGTSKNDLRGHYLVKLGSNQPQWARGRCYIFHNTTLQPPPLPGMVDPSFGADSGVVNTSSTKYTSNLVTRNNIIHPRKETDRAFRDSRKFKSNDFDWDLYIGTIDAHADAQKHGINATPNYERSPDGRLWLKPGTPGHDAALRISNFNDGFVGEGPDMGAVETGTTSPKPPLWPDFPEVVEPGADAPAASPEPAAAPAGE